jgi:hypothetical protein
LARTEHPGAQILNHRATRAQLGVFEYFSVRVANLRLVIGDENADRLLAG